MVRAMKLGSNPRADAQACLEAAATDNASDGAERAFLTYLLDTLDFDSYADLQQWHLRARSKPAKFLDLAVWLRHKYSLARRLDLDKRKPMRILDIGCGPSHFGVVGRYLGHEIVGLDIPANALYGDLNDYFDLRRFVHAVRSMRPLPPDLGRYDMITALSANFYQKPDDTLWTIEEWRFFIRNAVRDHLSPGGALFQPQSAHRPCWPPLLGRCFRAHDRPSRWPRRSTDGPRHICRRIALGLVLPFRPSSDHLLGVMEAETSSMLRRASRNRDGRANAFSWTWAHYAETALTAFTRTGDERFVDWLAQSYEQVLLFRDCALGITDEHRGRITASWGSGRYKPGTWMTHVTMGGRITYPSLGFARIVLILGDSQRFARHRERAQRYVAIAQDVVHEYDEDFVTFVEAGEDYYEMPAKDEVDTINHVHSLVNCHIALWELVGDEECRDKAVQCCKVFESAITERRGAYSWPLRPLWTKQKNNRRAEPTWKAHVSAATAMHAWRAGIYFDRSDMAAIANMVATVLLPGDLEIRDRISERHGKTDWAEMDPRYRWRLANIVGFLPWAEFDPSIATKILHRIRNNDVVFKADTLGLARGSRGYAYLLGEAGDAASA